MTMTAMATLLLQTMLALAMLQRVTAISGSIIESIHERIKPKPCGVGYFACGNTTACVLQKQQCDGTWHCPNGEDETYELCQDNSGFHSEIVRMHNITKLASNNCTLAIHPTECQCLYGTRLFCRDLGLTSVPTAFFEDISINTTRLLLSRNEIVNVDDFAFAEFTNLHLLFLDQNYLEELPPHAFAGLPNLNKLSLVGNKLRSLPRGLFVGLTNLRWLFLQENRLVDFEPGLFHGLGRLSWLDLRQNRLQMKQAGTLAGATNLNWIDLEQNDMRTISNGSFEGVPNVTILLLSLNRISRIETNALRSLENLVELDLTDNRITKLRRDMFIKNQRLSNLQLSYNPFTDMPHDVFTALKNIESLNLTGIRLRNISEDMFRNLTHLHFVYFRDFQYCSYVPHAKVCRPLTDGISTFEQLLANHVLRICVWVMALITCLGNLTVGLGRTLMRGENRIHSLFIKNLCLSDFLMGIYLFVIGAQDVRFRDVYRQNSRMWIDSTGCQVIGFLAMVSCEVSIMILTYMSVERFVCIVCPFGSHNQSMRYAYLAASAIWAGGVLLAAIPLMSREAFGNFYGSSGICFPLHIHDAHMVGWQYSAFVFLGLNLVAFVVITASYCGMFVSIQRTRRKTTLFNTDDMSFAKRFFFIVLTDAFCWIPIIITKLLAFSIDIPMSLYAWIAVFILPVNSAVNPILYTLTTTHFRNWFRKTIIKPMWRPSSRPYHYYGDTSQLHRNSRLGSDSSTFSTATSRVASAVSRTSHHAHPILACPGSDMAANPAAAAAAAAAADASPRDSDNVVTRQLLEESAV